jgi:hypothetical protein
MRVFYIDEDIVKRIYYVRIDNISVPDTKKATKVIEAVDVEELLSEICEYYGFKKENIQLWSGLMGYSNRVRLDTMVEIPEKCEDIYVRGIVKNVDTK